MKRQGSAAKLGLDLNQLKRRATRDQTPRVMTLPIQITMPTLHTEVKK